MKNLSILPILGQFMYFAILYTLAVFGAFTILGPPSVITKVILTIIARNHATSHSHSLCELPPSYKRCNFQSRGTLQSKTVRIAIALIKLRKRPLLLQGQLPDFHWFDINGVFACVLVIILPIRSHSLVIFNLRCCKRLQSSQK